jgi:hypothetical protein
MTAGMTVDKLDPFGAIQISEMRMPGANGIKTLAQLPHESNAAVPDSLKCQSGRGQRIETSPGTQPVRRFHLSQAASRHGEKAEFFSCIRPGNNGHSVRQQLQIPVLDRNHMLHAFENRPPLATRLDKRMFRRDIASGIQKIPTAFCEDSGEIHEPVLSTSPV